DELAARHARAELAQAEGQARRQRTPAERDELRRRVHEIADRVTRDAASADAEQRLGREVQARDHQVTVEDDERGREPLHDAAGVDALAAAAVRSERRRALQLPLRSAGPCGGDCGFCTLVCCTWNVCTGVR